MKLIGLTGGMGSGKSTAVEFLKEKYGADKVKLVKFAQPLYDIQNYVYKRTDQGLPVTKDRKLLQFIGTEWGRGIDKDFWLKLWVKEAISALAGGNIVVADDVRFDNEAEVIIKMGGALVEIISDKASERIDTNSGIKNHASENGIREDLVEWVVMNNGTLEQYKSALSNTFSVALGNNK